MSKISKIKYFNTLINRNEVTCTSMLILLIPYLVKIVPKIILFYENLNLANIQLKIHTKRQNMYLKYILKNYGMKSDGKYFIITVNNVMYNMRKIPLFTFYI